MNTVYTSTSHLLMHGPNQSFGNHMLHIFYLYHLAKKRNFNFKISANSNLDNIFDLSEFKSNYPNNIVCLYDEMFGGNPDEFGKKENLNFVQLYKILNEKDFKFPENFYLKGWFWHHQFIPPYTIFKDLKLKKENIDLVIKKYNNFLGNGGAVLHYRGTDFKNHSIGWGDLRLSLDYYEKSLYFLKKTKNINKCLIVSDEPNYIVDNLKNIGVDFEISDEIYFIDWIILFLSKNIICSNSSFCWTASSFNKEICIQPKGFFLHNINKKDVFPPNVYYNNSIKI